MTTGDDHSWGPRGDDPHPSPSEPPAHDPWAPEGTSTSPSGSTPPGRPAIPDGNAWAPPPPEPIRRPPVAPAESPDAAAAPVESVEVAAVEAAPARGRGAIGRVAAAGVAAVMLGGGAFLVVNAASSKSGAESPEAAFEAAMAAVEAEDVVALAEIMEPSERDTVFEAGFDFVDELVRLEVLDPGVDLSSIEGIDLEFEGFEPRVERPGNDLAHVFVGEGTVTGSIDVAALPLGPLLVDRMSDDQLTFTDSSEETTGPSTTPLVAVERDGRWYLSLWYTVAENVRLEADMGLPDLSRRPATIGGDSPEAAVRQMMDDAVRLDLGRVIGSFDPEEMAVLYDYAPLFLDEADAAANEVLSAAAEEGWSWEIVDLGLSSETDGDLATVRMENIHFRADAENGGFLDLQIGDGVFRFDLVAIDDFFESEFRVSAALDGECIVVTFDEGNGPSTEQICDGDLGVELSSGLGEVTDQLDALGMVTRQVDGVWYVSPIRTGLDAMVTAIEQVDPETLQEFADLALDFGTNGVFIEPDFGSGLALPGPDTDDDAFLDSFDPLAGSENADLLAEALNPSFVWDLDAIDAAQELEFWVSGLTVETARGVYTTVPAASGGDVALTVTVLSDPDAGLAAFVEFADANGLARSDRAGGGQMFETVDSFDDPVLVVIDGDQLMVLGVYGATVEDARQILDLQTGS